MAQFYRRHSYGERLSSFSKLRTRLITLVKKQISTDCQAIRLEKKNGAVNADGRDGKMFKYFDVRGLE